MSVIRRRITLIETAVVVLTLAILAGVMVPCVSNAVNNSIWVEGKIVAAQIQQSAKLFCMEKGEKFDGWKHITLWDLGFNNQELNGKYFKRDAYSIKFRGHDDFVVTVNSTKTDGGVVVCNMYSLLVLTVPVYFLFG